MTTEAGRRRPRRTSGGIPQLPLRTVRNPLPPGRDPVRRPGRGASTERRSGSSSEIGVEVLGDRAIDRLAAAPARRSTARRGASGWIRPWSRSWSRRRRRRSRSTPGTRRETPTFGGAHLVFSAGRRARRSSPTSTAAGGPATTPTSWTTSGVIGALDVVHQEGGGPLEPTDLPVATRHLDMYRAFATLLDKTWHCLGFGAAVVEDALEVAALARGVDRDALAAEPSADHDHQHELAAPPRRADVRRPDRDGEAGQPVVATPFTLAGAMSPVDARRRDRPAERRGAVLRRARPARPARRAGGLRRRSPRTSTCGPGRRRSGRRSTSRRAIATGQMARRYGLPWRSSNATASNVVDAQAAYESRDGGLGRGDGRREPALPGRRLARGRPDRVVREADRRRGDPPDDGRGPRSRSGSTTPSSGSTRSPRSGRAATSSRPPTRSSATRPRSTGRSCRTGGTSRPGRTTARGPRRSARTASGSSSSRSSSRRRSTRRAAEAIDDFVERRKREIEAAPA